MVPRKRGRWNSERGTGGPTAVCLFRLPRSDFRVRSVASLPDQHAPRPALSFARRGHQRKPGADCADEHGLAECALDTSHWGVAAASRSSAKTPALSPPATVADSGETVTDATGPGLRPGIESPEESTAAASPSGRPALSRSLQAATASAVAASAAVRTPFMRCLRECVQTGYPGLLVPRHISRRPVHRHSRSDLPFTLRIPHSTFRIAMTVQAIAWSPSGAVRIVDQRALPEAKIERDLESGEAVADAIRTLQLRGAPLIGIAAAMGLVAGMRELRAAPRDRFLARLDELARLLGATRPTAVNLRWALDRMVRVAAETPDSWGGAAIWERLQAEATAIWEEDRAMCRRIGEAGLALIPDGAKVLTHCNAGALATGGIRTRP